MDHVDKAEIGSILGAGHSRARSDYLRSAGLLALASLMFAGMAIFAKLASARLPGPEVAFLRFAIGMLTIAVPLLTGHPLRPHRYGALFGRGVLGAAAVLLYFGAIRHLSVGVATLLNSSWPLFAAVFAVIFLRETLRIDMVMALILTGIGVALVVLAGPGAAPGTAPSGASPLALPSRNELLWGGLGIASAMFSGAAVTTVRALRKSEGAWEIFLAFCFFGGLLTLPPTVFLWVTPTTQDVVWLLLMGVCSAAAQFLLTYSLRDVPAVMAGLILQVTPIATFVVGVAFLGDHLTMLGALGATITLCGVTWGMIQHSASSATSSVPNPPPSQTPG